MRISIGALLTLGTSGVDKAAKETKVIKDNLQNAKDQAELLNKTLGKTGASAAKKGGHTFNDRDGISTRENRGAKGVSGQRGAAGRDFAGLRDASDSTSGIVAAYATAAANMFALTAAFKALSDAAKVEQLRQGLELVGAQSGVTLGLVAKNLQKVTGYGISAAESMKSVAQATAAGFSGKEIERLGGVARGAAVALGRDMSDAMDRLTRGAVKLEPELLDELGIMTRIDDATRAYADAHDKAKSSLTQTERRQAFLNAVLTEGEAKFSSIADSVPISQFDRLQASMKNMATGGLGLLVKTLDPVISMLADMPALLLLPMAGMLTSIANKLVPSAMQQLDKIEKKAISAAKSLELSKKNRAIRIDQLDPTIDAARNRARDKLGITVGGLQDRKIDTLKTERALVIEDIGLQKEKLRLALAQGDAAKAKLLTERIAVGEAAKSAYTQAIGLTPKNRKGDVAVAKKSFAFSMQALAAAQYERTLIEIDAREGDMTGKFVAGLKGVRAQWTNIGKSVGEYRTGLKAANIEAGLGSVIIMNIKTAWGAAKAAAFAFGMTGKLAIQGLVAAIPIIGWIITAVTILGSAFEFFKSEKDKAMDGLKNDLKDILTNVDKVNEQIDKFREKGQFGKAFEAEIGSLTEIYNKLKEIMYLKDKPEKKAKLASGEANHNVKRLADGDADIAKGLSTSLSRIETFKGADYVKNLTREMDKVKDQGGDWLAVMEPAVKGAETIAKSWTDIGESVKKGGQAIRKFWGDDFFKTDYTEIASVFRDITTELKAQDQYITDPAAKIQAASDVMSQFVAGGKDMFLEMDRVMGNTTTFTKTYTDFAAKQLVINDLNKAGDDKSLATAKKLTAELTAQQAAETAKIRSSGVLQKIALEELKIKQATIALENNKKSVELQELLNAARLAKNAIETSQQTIQRMKAAGGFDELLQGYDKVDAIKQAEIEYSNATRIKDIKDRVLDREFELAALQKSLLLYKAKLEAADAQKAFNKQWKDENGNIKASAFAENSAGAYDAYKADLAALDVRNEIIGLLVTEGTIELSIRDRKKEANQTEIDTKKQALDAAKASFADSINNLKKELDLATARLEIELKISAIKRQAISNKQELDRTRRANDASRTDFGGLDTLGQLEETKLKAIQDSFTAWAAEQDRKKSENNVIAGLKAKVDLAQGMKDKAQGFREKWVAEDKLKKVSEEYQTAITMQTFNAQASADALATLGEVVRNTTKDIGVIKDLPGRLNKQMRETVQAQTRAVANVGANMGGYGAEAQAAIDAEWTKRGVKDFGGDYNKFIKSNDVVLIKQAAFEMKQLSIVTEGITNVSMAFNEQLAGAFSSIIDGSKDAKDAFADLALSMLKMIADIIAQLLAMQAVKMIGQSFGIPMPAAGGGIMPMATGGIMSRSAGGVHGVVNKPTYLVGEGRYNEAVVPLPNGRAIPVQMHGNNTSSNNVQVNVHLNQQGEAKTQTQGPDMNNLGAMISQVVLKELQAQKMPGGVLNRYGAA